MLTEVEKQKHNIGYGKKKTLPVEHNFVESEVTYNLGEHYFRADFLGDLKPGDVIVCDTETSGLSPHCNIVTLVQLTSNGKDVFILTKDDMEDPYIKYWFNGIMSSPDYKKVFHNAKFDIKMLMHHYGTEFNNYECTQVMRRLLVSGLNDKSDLKSCAIDYLGYEQDKETRDFFIGCTDVLAHPEVEDMLRYAAIDVAVTYEIYPILKAYLDIENLDPVYEHIERPLIQVVAEMENLGVCVDLEFLKKLEVLVSEKIGYLQEKLDLKLNIWGVMPEEQRKLLKRDMSPDQKLAGVTHVMVTLDSLNVNSSKQVTQVLNSIGFKVDSAGKEVLDDPTYTNDSLEVGRNLLECTRTAEEVLSDGMEVITLIRGTREARKALDAFIIPLQVEHSMSYQPKKEDKGKFLNPVTKKIHTSFNQLAADTGRFSSSHPNVQQMPSARKNHIFGDIPFRRAFIPSPGYGFSTWDYKACELLILAELSKDENLIKATWADDVHKVNAALVFSKEIEDVTPFERFVTKTVTYGLVYGSGGRKIAQSASTPDRKMTVEEGKQVISRFLAAFPKLKIFINNRKEFVTTNYYSATISGRKRYFNRPTFKGDGKKLQWEIGAIERAGVNAPIQGCNADCTKYAMVLLRDRIKPLGGRILLTVHDELVVEAPLETLEEVHNITGATMLEAQREFLLNVNCAVDGSFGMTWGH